MRPAAARKHFLEDLKASGTTVKGLSPEQGIELMLDFYRRERADGCDPDQDGDMLLYQWGEGEEGEAFQLDITRQMIETGDEDDGAMRQLSLTFKFELTDDLRRLGEGDRWCETPDTLDKFRQFILKSKAYKAVADREPVGRSLVLDEI